MQYKKSRVLIVDDEFRIGMLINKLIHWNELDMECVDVVDNSEKALKIIQEEDVDIVITDIRMPRISGLDMISMVKNMEKGVKFVVVSGYKEFEYAHTALQYGVEDYLLKPINEKELNDVMKKISVENLNKYNQSLEKIKLEETITRSRHIIKRDFLKNIIDKEDTFDVNDSTNMLVGEIYRGIDIKLDYVDYNKYDNRQDKMTVEKIVSLVETSLKKNVSEVFLCEKDNLHIYGLFSYDYSKSKDIRNSINSLLSEINDYLMGFEQYVVTIGVGTERSDFSEIRFTIKESNKAICNRIKIGTERIIYAESITFTKNNDQIEKLTADQKLAITNSIKSYSKDGIFNIIDKIVLDIRTNKNGDISYCYNLVENLITFFFENEDVQPDNFSDLERNIKSKCQHCYTLEMLSYLLKSSLGSVIDESREAMEAESSKPIRQAQQFIEEHYSEKIVLEDFTEVVGLNSVYFSVLFKKETGKNFSSYLTSVRMEKAKEMLCNTNETIAAIAYNVGYKDTKYFSQAFTKNVGVKPALYRKLHS